GTHEPDQEVEQEKQAHGRQQLGTATGGQDPGSQVRPRDPSGQCPTASLRTSTAIGLLLSYGGLQRGYSPPLLTAPPALLGDSDPTQLRSSTAPASPDFSGWNWVALSGPFSTAATNRSPPCSLQVTSGGWVRPWVWSTHERAA